MVGAGPNGLSAAIRLAHAGRAVVVVESATAPGGGVRSAELTLPGFVHDVCSSVYPMTVCSPYLRSLPLQDHGLQWIFPPIAMAHPLDGEQASAVLLYNSLEETVAGLGAADGAAYRHLIGDLLAHWPELFAGALRPLRPTRLRHSLLMARFGLRAFSSARSLARRAFVGEPARALFAGLAAHSMLPLEQLSTSAVALVLCVAAHAAGWPFVRGGAQQLTAAMVSYLKSLGGQVITGCHVESLDDLPPARAFAARRYSSPIRAHGRRTGKRAFQLATLPAPIGTISLRRRCIQSRLGAQLARSLARTGMRAGGNSPSGRDTSGDLRLGAASMGWPGFGAAVRAVRATQFV